ncbi:hypothetical protein [Methanobacterium sp. BAmetb5]|uniref:hypothetical protein n=1 Tax=Methanobacterium sp. BAmetb5 TaxID=2025351 RepID=UPI0025DD26D4|nr:hypothetical protein [Methanobacterium sp. BAmetb5]
MTDVHPTAEVQPTEFNINYQIPKQDYLFHIKWEENRLSYNEFNPLGGINHQRVIYPELDDWAEFWQVMDDLEVWNWYEEYLVSCGDSCVVGDEWEVSMWWKDQRMESHGANSYPNTFQEFLKATEELTGILIEFIQED